MAENTYTITALDAANDDALWQQVARGEVEVTGAERNGEFTLLSFEGKFNSPYLPAYEFRVSRGDRHGSVSMSGDYTFTVHRLQPPTDTPPGEPPAEAGDVYKWWYAYGVDELPCWMTAAEANNYTGPFDTAVEATRACLKEHYAYEEALQAERDALQAANAQVAARAERAEAALTTLFEQTQALLNNHADLVCHLWPGDFRRPFIDESQALDLRQVVITAMNDADDVLTVLRAPLADDGDAQTEDGG